MITVKCDYWNSEDPDGSVVNSVNRLISDKQKQVVLQALLAQKESLRATSKSYEQENHNVYTNIISNIITNMM